MVEYINPPEMIKKLIHIIICLALLLSCRKDPVPVTYPGIGDTLPQFSIVLSDGKPADTAELSKGMTLLVFFHTGCPDCVAELKLLQPFYEKHREDVRLILISRAEGPESIKKHWSENGYTMPYSPQKDRTVYDLFSKSGIPYTVLSKEGTILGIWDDKDMFTEEKYNTTIKEYER